MCNTSIVPPQLRHDKPQVREAGCSQRLSGSIPALNTRPCAAFQSEEEPLSASVISHACSLHILKRPQGKLLHQLLTCAGHSYYITRLADYVIHDSNDTELIPRLLGTGKHTDQH